MNRTITARRLYTDIGSVEYPVLSVAENGTLADISSDPRALAAERDVLTAAFVDVHTHGALGHDVMSATPGEFRELQGFLAAHGVAHYLPSTVTAPVDATLSSLGRLADAIEAASGEDHGGEARPVGIHIEGPFLSHARRGMHPAADLQPASVELFDRLQAAARGHICLMTIAPELPGAIELIRYATVLGVRCSLGHTNALAAEALAGIAAGAVSATHTFNAMRALDHREPGVLGTVLDENGLFAELICDGVHVAPPLVRLWWNAKGAERGILVTDSLAAAGMPNGEYVLGTTAVRVRGERAVVTADLEAGKETLAGSVLTLDRAVANLQSFVKADLAVATRLASHNPAAMLGRPELTRLAPGSPANLNRFDSKGQLVATYLDGREVVGGREVPRR